MNFKNGKALFFPAELIFFIILIFIVDYLFLIPELIQLFFYINTKSPINQLANYSLKQKCLKNLTYIPSSLIMGLEIEATGRFGNNLIGILQAFRYCCIFNLRYLIVPKKYLFINESFYANGIKIIPKKYDTDYSSYIFKYPFAYPLPTCHIAVNYNDIVYMKDFLNSRFQNMNLNKDDLYIHIRSGDIFIKHPNKHLGQPPLNYYLDIINSRKWNDIHIIAENDKNPVIKELVKRGYKFSSSTLINDMSTLLNAQNLVIGPGSFGQALVLLTKKLKTLYAFQYYIKYSYPTWESAHVCIPDDLYKKKIHKNWQNTDEQIHVMHISNCSKWYVNYNRSII